MKLSWASARLESIVEKYNTIQGITPKSPKTWKEHSTLNTCSNWTSEQPIGIHAKIRC